MPLIYALLKLVPVGTMPAKISFFNALLSVGSVWLLVSCQLFRERIRFCLLVMSGILLFSWSHWVQVVRQELYVLQLFLFAFSWWSACRCYSTKDPRWLFLLSLVLGLSLANHYLLAVFTILPVLVFTLAHLPKNARGSRVLLVAFACLVCGVSIFVYLPLRAQAGPALNFGNPQSWESFVWVVSGKLYGSYDAPTLATLWENASSVLAMQMQLFSPIGWLLVLVGLGYFFAHHHARWLMVAAIVVTVLPILPNTQLYTSNPDAHGYLLVHFWLCFLFGLAGLFEFAVARLPTNLSKALPVVALILVIFQAGTVFSRKMQPYLRPNSDMFVFSVTSGLPHAAEIVSGSYKTYTQLIYAQQVNNWRSDLQITYRGMPHYNYNRPQGLYPGQLFELAIGMREGSISTRMNDEELRAIESVGWFYRLRNTPVSDQSLQEELSRRQGAILDIKRGLASTHPGLKEQLELSDFLFDVYVDAQQDSFRKDF